MPRKPQENSIYKIAEETGFSIATVSRVLHRRPGVSEEARRKVETAIELHKFTPNYPQPAFRNIALVMPKEATLKGGGEYLSNLICHVARNAEELEMNTCLVFQGIDERGTLLDKLRRQQASGALLVLGGLLKEDILELKDSGLPLISIDGRLDLDFAGYVDNDASNGIEEAVRHLAGLKHKRIAFLYNRPELSNHIDRRDCYLRAMEKRGLKPMLEEFAPDCDYISVKKALARALAAGASAVMTVNDSTALQALHACRDLKVSVPEELSVVGFDNDPASEHYCPPLTTIEHPIRRICEEAVRSLFSLCEREGSRKLPKTELNTHLIVRESTAAPGARSRN